MFFAKFRSQVPANCHYKQTQQTDFISGVMSDCGTGTAGANNKCNFSALAVFCLFLNEDGDVDVIMCRSLQHLRYTNNRLVVQLRNGKAPDGNKAKMILPLNMTADKLQEMRKR